MKQSKILPEMSLKIFQFLILQAGLEVVCALVLDLENTRLRFRPMSG